jgi:hypothetical protein
MRSARSRANVVKHSHMTPTADRPANAMLVRDSLFSPGERVDRLPRSASAYARLDRGPFAYHAHVRELLDEWYRRLPDSAQKSIRKRFTSGRRDQHLGAFFELYMHELTGRSGFDSVEIDVGQEDPAQITPDLTSHRGSEAIPIEATVCLGDDVVDPRDRPRLNQLYDAVELIDRGAEFMLHVDVRKIGPDTLGRRTVTRFLNQWLEGLDPDEELARATRDEPAACATFDCDGWNVLFIATGVQPELRAQADLGVIGGVTEGLGGFTHRVVGENTIEFDGPRPLKDHELLARALLGKAKQGYDAGDRPLVVAVMCAGDFVEDREIAQALLGPIQYRLGGGGHYEPGGLWRDGGGWRYRRVAAVLTFAQLSPTSVAVVEPTLWLNPAADHPLRGHVFPWRTMAIAPDGRIIEHPATRTVAEILSISPAFPRFR